MPLIGAFMVPHPPLIIPSVGKGSEKQVAKTIDSYKKIAKEIQILKPDTIIVISPHSTCYRDYIHISPGKTAKGNFKDFNSNEEINVEYDTELREKIIEIAKQNNFPAGVEGEKNKMLDHGTMVPLYYINEEYNKYKCIRIGVSDLPLKDHYRFGILIKKAIESINRNVVIVASGDLSHKLKEYGPYGYIKEGPIYDEMIMNTIAKADFKELINYDKEFLEKVAVCGHQSFSIMAGTLDKKDVKVNVYSHEDITGVGYGIASLYPIKEDYKRCFLESNDPYVKLAKETINTYINEKRIIEIPKNTPQELLENKKGVFVTIYEFGELRGCIGTFMPTKSSIAKEIIDNAILSATEDYRFNPIEKNELNNLEIKVDVLNTPEKINNKDELDPKKYGIIITQYNKRGLLLPDIEGVDTIEKQISIAKQKGNIVGDNYEIERFTVERHT